MTDANKEFVVAHSPDPDDAFMYFGMAKGHVSLPGYTIKHRIADIHQLNKLAVEGVDEVTAISAASYPEVAHNYRIMTVGASVGRGYGPIVVAKEEMDLTGKRIAVPGLTTTARLMSRLLLPPYEEVEVPFDKIFDAIEADEVDAGVLIHEGQLTYPDFGVVKLMDLADIWKEKTGYPIPLGLDVVSRDLPESVQVAFAEAMAESILCAYENIEDAAAYAQEFGRGISKDQNLEFVQMYVNLDTLHLGEDCCRSLEALYSAAAEQGMMQDVPPLDFVTPQNPEIVARILEFRDRVQSGG